MKKEIECFQRQLLQLDPIEFIGITKILGVSLVTQDDKKEPLSFEEVYFSVVEKFKQLSRRKRQNLSRILRAAEKKKDD